MAAAWIGETLNLPAGVAPAKVRVYLDLVASADRVAHGFASGSAITIGHRSATTPRFDGYYEFTDVVPNTLITNPTGTVYAVTIIYPDGTSVSDAITVANTATFQNVRDILVIDPADPLLVAGLGGLADVDATGTDGQVLTIQADGTYAFEDPTGGGLSIPDQTAPANTSGSTGAPTGKTPSQFRSFLALGSAALAATADFDAAGAASTAQSAAISAAATDATTKADAAQTAAISAAATDATTKADAAQSAAQAFATAADAALVPKATGTAKGDILGFSASGTPAVRAIGTDGMVLMPDSTDSLGFVWSWPATLGFDVRFTGARADAVQITGASITSGSAVLSWTGATAAMAGKTVVIAGAGAAAANLYATVSSVSVGTSLTLSVTASTSRSASTAYGMVGTDNTTAFQQAITFAISLGIAAYAPQGDYLFTGATGIFTSTTLVPNLVCPHIRGDGSGKTRLWPAVSVANKSFIAPVGSIGVVNTTTSGAVAAGAATITNLTSTTGMAAGKRLFLQDSTQPITSDNSMTTQAIVGEIVRIKAVVDSTTVTIYGATKYAYTTGTVVKQFDPATNLRIEGITFDNPIPLAQLSGCNVVSPSYTEGVYLKDVHFKNADNPSFRFQQCLKVRVHDCEWSDHHSDNETHLDGTTALAYMILNAYSHDVQISNCRGERGRHFVTTVSSATNIQGDAMLCSNLVGRDFTETTFDTHPGAGPCTFIGCQAINGTKVTKAGGFHLRGTEHQVIGCRVEGHYDGVRADGGADRALITGNTFLGVDVGVNLISADQAKITNNQIQASVSALRVSEWTGTWVNHIQQLEWDGNWILGNPSTAVLDFTTGEGGGTAGSWKNTYKIGATYAPDATTFHSGMTVRTLASAATLPIVQHGDYFSVTGGTAITNITGIGYPGRRVTLVFAAATNVTSGANGILQHAGTINFPVGSSLTLVTDGLGNWREVSRSGAPPGVIYVKKASDQTNATNTLADDSELTTGALQTNGIYKVRMSLAFQAAIATDMNFKINMPTGATFEGRYAGPATNATAANNWLSSNRRLSGTSNTGTNPVGGTATDGTPTNQTAVLTIEGILTMAGNTGTCVIQWCQSASTADTVTVKAGSFMLLERIG